MEGEVLMALGCDCSVIGANGRTRRLNKYKQIFGYYGDRALTD